MSKSASFQASDTGWVVHFDDGMIEMLPENFALLLSIDSSVIMRIESEWDFYPPGSLVAALRFEGPVEAPPWSSESRVDRLEVRRSGKLDLIFADSGRISVEPHPLYESFQIRELDPAHIDDEFDSRGYSLRPSDDGFSMVTTNGPSGFGFAFVGRPEGGLSAWTKHAFAS